LASSYLADDKPPATGSDTVSPLCPAALTMRTQHREVRAAEPRGATDGAIRHVPVRKLTTA